MTTPAVPFYTQPSFALGGGGNPNSGNSPTTATPSFGLNAQNYGAVVHGFMEWDVPAPGYSSNAVVNFQFNPSTLAIAYYQQQSSTAVTDFIFSLAAASAAPTTPMLQSISFALLYDRTYELWGSYGAAGLPNTGYTSLSSDTDINDPAIAGVGVDILAMQQLTGMFIGADTGTGNATATPGIGGTTAFKPQFPMIWWGTWVYFGNNPAGLYYYGYVTDWEVQVTQWSQYMIPMRAVINVDFTLLPTSQILSGTPAGPGLSQYWSANPLGGPATSASSGTGPGATGPGVSTKTAGGIRG